MAGVFEAPTRSHVSEYVLGFLLQQTLLAIMHKAFAPHPPLCVFTVFLEIPCIRRKITG